MHGFLGSAAGSSIYKLRHRSFGFASSLSVPSIIQCALVSVASPGRPSETARVTMESQRGKLLSEEPLLEVDLYSPSATTHAFYSLICCVLTALS